MTIETKTTAYKIRNFIVTIVLLIPILIFLILDVFENKSLDYIFTIICAAAYILYWVYQGIIGTAYFFYTDEEKQEKLIFRFFPLMPFSKNFKAIEIPKTRLANFEFVKSFLNQKEQLVLYHKTKKGDAKYPPINTTLLTEQERKNLVISLERYVKRD